MANKVFLFVLVFMWDSSENYIAREKLLTISDMTNKKNKKKLSQRVMGIQVIWLQNNSTA